VNAVVPMRRQDTSMVWRYFALYPGTNRLQGLYRCPDNGKKLFEQNLADVEIYRGDGGWQGGQRQRLLHEVQRGWFDEIQDEISEEQAILLMDEIG
jgi:hypothetical protein